MRLREAALGEDLGGAEFSGEKRSLGGFVGPRKTPGSPKPFFHLSRYSAGKRTVVEMKRILKI